MNKSVQYTIRNIPPAIDAKLKAQAKKRGISMNKLVLDKLGALPKKDKKLRVYHDLDWMFEDITPELLADIKLAEQAIAESRKEERARARAEYEAEKARGEWG